MTVLVKICGLVRPQDVDAAVAAGADMVGFVLVSDSPRGVGPEQARRLAERVPEGVRTVAVVSDTGAGLPDTLRRAFDLVQVYGLPADFRDTIVASRGEPPQGVPEGVPILLDLARDSNPSGAELQRHWNRARGVRHPIVLSGSLHPANVAEAVASARPLAVDTARGVESAPGIKHHGLIEQFIRQAKEAG